MRRFHHHWYGDVYVLHVFCLHRAFRWDLLTIERTVRFRHHWHGDIWFSWWLHRDSSWNNGRIGVWILCFRSEKERCFATSPCGSFTMMVVEFREFGGVLATQRKIRMNLETTFYLHGHGNQLLNKIENKQHVQMSFRCVWQFAVSFCGDCIASFKFGMSENIRSEMHACERIFSSQGKLGSK